MKPSRCLLFFGLGLITLLVAGPPASAQKPFALEQILSYSFSYDLVSAKKADRLAWLEFNQGTRNVYTASAPDFKPVRLTNFMADDGTDLTNLLISDDGAVIVFVRGHDPNRQGWVANPSQFPDGSEQAIWAVRPSEAKPFRLAAGSSPELSPDGKWVLFVKDGQIYGVAVKPAVKKVPGRDDEKLSPLFRTWGTNGNPRWSPDSKRIAFTSDRQDHSFIGVCELVGRKITYLAPSVDRDTNPTWSGDGKKIAFIRRPGSAFAQIIAQSQTQGPPRQPSFRAMPFREQTQPQPVQPQQMATGPGFQAAKFADGHTLTFWVADVVSGKAEKVWHNPLDDQSFLAIRQITWAGESLVFQLERNNWRHYYSVLVLGGVDLIPTNLTPGEGEAEFVGFSPDGKSLYYTTNVGDIDRRDLWQSPTSGGAPVQLTKGDGIETEPAPLASGRSIAVFYSDAKRPRCVALVPAQGGDARIINPKLSSDFPLESHVVPESVILKAEDGLEFHNQLFLPKDIQPGERRPAILFSHGGPGRQMLLGYHYMFFYHMAYAVNQYFANKGYVVISVNYRSGIGYGREFRMAPNRGAAGSSEYQDIVAAAKYLQSRPDVDPNRIGLWGLSYGGLLTAMGLSRNSDIFKAGVDIAGVHLRGNSLDTNSTAFKASTLATIDKWTSPVLLVQGDDDRNVAFSQTTGLVQLLRARNVHHELIVFPDEVHDFLVFKKWVTVLNAADDFFNRFLRKP
jgi:dipeptidyl-peptidase-4